MSEYKWQIVFFIYVQKKLFPTAKYKNANVLNYKYTKCISMFLTFTRSVNVVKTQTYPQLKLTSTWLGLTRLLLFLPHHPPTGNSTSTRNKGPSGQKFCMRPMRLNLTKLTTTKQNFDPIFFFLDKNKSDPNLLYQNIF